MHICNLRRQDQSTYTQSMMIYMYIYMKNTGDFLHKQAIFCIFVYIHKYMFIYIYIVTYLFTYVIQRDGTNLRQASVWCDGCTLWARRRFILMYMCVYIHMCMYMYLYIYMYVYTYVCIYIYIYMYMYIHVCMCIYEMQRDRTYLREPSIRLVVCIVGTGDSTRAGYLDGFRYSGNMYMNTYLHVYHKYVYIYIYVCTRHVNAYIDLYSLWTPLILPALGILMAPVILVIRKCIPIHMYIYKCIFIRICTWFMCVHRYVRIVDTSDGARAGYRSPPGYLDGFRYSGNMCMNIYLYVYHKYVYIDIHIYTYVHVM